MAFNLSLDDDVMHLKRHVFFDRTLRGYLRELHDSYSEAANRVTAMLEESRRMREETRDLLSDFSQFSGRVHQLRRLHRQVQMEAATRHDELDDQVYLKGMIRHLVDANARLKFVPCVVRESRGDPLQAVSDPTDKKEKKGKKEKKKERKDNKKAK